MIRKMRGRLASERGSVGVVVALVIFLVMGMLVMTWNTAQLSKTKMRLQNAADSAALAHAVWQARGMNVVQNINDEMYEGLSLAVKLRIAGEALEVLAEILDGLANIPYIGIAFKVAAVTTHTFAVLFAGTGGWIATRICKYFLKYLSLIYVKGSALIGIWNAQLFAAMNEADPGVRLNVSGRQLGLYTLGFSWPFKDAFMLPLALSGKDEVKKSPWKVKKTSAFDAATQPWKALYKITGAGEEWEIKPYVSKRGDKEGIKVTKEKKDGKETTKVDDQGVLPAPTLWIAFKLGGNIHTLPLDGFWNPGDKDRKTHKIPFLAVAGAQCITGDVVPHSKKSEKDKTNQRPAGFGAGATAKLVPVGEVFKKWEEKLGWAVNAIIYH